jgi:glutamate synthase (NADPH/NADH) small chain
MPTQAPQLRIKNFSEVALGYSKEQALEEATRCLQCKTKPCVSGCPVAIDIPAFIKQFRADDIEGAYRTITQNNLFPGICGRVCPQESQCELHCIRGLKGESVAIGRLERFVADNVPTCTLARPVSNDIKVAMVGSGPASLTCANELAKLGYDVTIFEALHAAGGVLIYGIPEFRLPKAIVNSEIDQLKSLGVRFITNVIIGKTITVDQLFSDGYQAIFIGSGAGLPKFMNISGEHLKGVFSANEFLTRVNLMKAYQPDSHTPLYSAKRICVVGGGNVAMDAARCALRLDSEEVSIIYRRTFDEMPARQEEVHHAQEEGVCFHTLTNPTRILGDESGKVVGLECLKMELGPLDASNRRSPIPIKGSEFVIPCDEVIMALGNYPNPLLFKNTPQLQSDNHGCIVVDEGLMTSIMGVFAGGDAVSGAATVILAMGAGKKAASSIHQYLQSKKAIISN